MDAIKNYMRQDDVALFGGFTTSKYSNSDDKNGWTLGIWGNATTPALDDKYLSFIAGSVSAYDSAYIKFDIKRTSTGPKKFVLGFYSDDKLISKTQEMEITTKYTNHQISIPQFSAISGELSIRLSAYQSYSSKAGSLTIADVSVMGTKK